MNPARSSVIDSLFFNTHWKVSIFIYCCKRENWDQTRGSYIGSISLDLGLKSGTRRSGTRPKEPKGASGKGRNKKEAKSIKNQFVDAYII